MPMPKKTQRAINRGRRKAGLKPTRFGVKKKKKQKGDLSEKIYVQHLRKKLGEKSVVFRTGINADEGVPDIMAYSHGKNKFL